MRVRLLGLLALLSVAAAVADEFDAALVVKTTPADAEIYLNGELRANSSPAVFRLAAGEYELRVSYAGLLEETVTVVLTADSTIVREVELINVDGHRDTLADGSLGPVMMLIPAGSFTMGSPSGESGRDSDERQHQVTIDEMFLMGRYEVTFDEYDRFAEATGRDKPSDRGWGRGNRPVINVSWHDATAYAEWLSEQTGETYRLPTEAEWEYAARAGTTTAYWWGDEVGTNRANCDGCGSQWDGEQTALVGSFEANPWGLYDTAGNVWEWTCSVFDGNYGGAEQDCISKNDADSPRVLRGGSWYNFPRWVRSAGRLNNAPGDRNFDRGVRLARSL